MRRLSSWPRWAPWSTRSKCPARTVRRLCAGHHVRGGPRHSRDRSENTTLCLWAVCLPAYRLRGDAFGSRSRAGAAAAPGVDAAVHDGHRLACRLAGRRAARARGTSRWRVSEAGGIPCIDRVVYHGGMIDGTVIRSRFEAMRPRLDERGRRFFCAAEARSVGYGGVSGVARATGIARSTINRGLKDLNSLDPAPSKLRRPGGGRGGCGVDCNDHDQERPYGSLRTRRQRYQQATDCTHAGRRGIEEGETDAGAALGAVADRVGSAWWTPGK
jgi:hypothetical protein